MSKIKTGLGRGLDALIRPQVKEEIGHPPSESSFVHDDGEQFNILSKIPVELISANPFQPRLVFEPEAFNELKKSILANGLIQPITVRRSGPNHFQLISGERRLKACKEIGYREIPAYIIKVDTDEAMLAMALIENIQREKLNPIEVGAAFKRLMDECGLTQEEIADKVGKDRSTIANSIRLLKLPKEIQDSLIIEEITAGHARALINLPSEQLQLDALKKIIENNLSVRKVEQLVKKLLTEVPQKKSFRISDKSFTTGTSLNSIEDRLRKIFGTKVTCHQKNDGSGEITIEFYSNDELERLFELFDIIDKSYN
ncbi:MAG: ParB/RepB/Spo0J family partition protein [Ignavibacteriales bacterium]|nr:MAG: ParB/RepB/Spo0J family partition protein [Ignavibacteriales bacterium]